MASRYELSNENLFMPLFSPLISLHNCSQLDLQLAGEEGDIASFIPNGEWSLLGESHSILHLYTNITVIWNMSPFKADIMNHNGSISEILFSKCNSYITGRRTVL